MYLDSNDTGTVDHLGVFVVDDAIAIASLVIAVGGMISVGVAQHKKAVQEQQERAATVVAWLRAQETQKIALEQARATAAKKTQQNVLMIGGAAVALVAGYFLLK